MTNVNSEKTRENVSIREDTRGYARIRVPDALFIGHAFWYNVVWGRSPKRETIV